MREALPQRMRCIRRRVHLADDTLSFKLQIHRPIELGGLLKVVAEPVRLRMLKLLSGQESLCCRLVPTGAENEGRDEKIYGLCVQDLVAHLGLPQSTVSHHLNVLKNAGLVRSVKQGVWVFYFRDEETVSALKRSINSL